MIVDGRAIAQDILEGLKKRRDALGGEIRLGIVVASRDPVIESFVRIKGKIAHDLNISLVRRDLTEPTTELAMDAVRELSREVDGIIVQLPLPATVDANSVISEIPVAKDVDAISTLAGEHSRLVHAPVALAVQEILTRHHVELSGRTAIVVGGGRLVGIPTFALLERLGLNVGMVTLEEGKMEDLAAADIAVLGAGQPGLIKPEHVKEGVVLIDAGASETAGVITGDADPACAKKASLFTPVPGGVGPIAVAMIFKNVLDLAERSR